MCALRFKIEFQRLKTIGLSDVATVLKWYLQLLKHFRLKPKEFYKKKRKRKENYLTRQYKQTKTILHQLSPI